MRATPSMVIDDDITWIAYANGDMVRMRPPVETPQDERAEDLRVLLNRLSEAVQHDSHPGLTIMVGARNAARLGFPPEAPSDLAEAQAHPALNGVRNLGWKVDRLGPWMTFHRHDRAAITIGVLPWLDTKTFELLDRDGANIAYRLAWMQHWLGASYRARPGVTALAGLRPMVKGKTPYWKPDWNHVEPVGPYETRMRREQEYIWDSPSSEVLELGHKFLHGWDIQGCFIAAASGAFLARDALRHTKKTEYDGSAGYWLIAVPAWNFSTALPHPAGNRVTVGEQAWVTSPRLELLTKLANDYNVTAAPIILDSWTAEKPARLLRPWAERVRDMVKAVEQEPDEKDQEILRKAAKHAYAHAISMFSNPDSSVHRPDWRDTIYGYAYSSFWLKLWLQYRADGRLPVKIFHDMAYYASSEHNPEDDRPSTFDTSGMIGRFRYGKKTVEL